MDDHSIPVGPAARVEARVEARRSRSDGQPADVPPRSASWYDTWRFVRDVAGPTVAKGIFVRRYPVVALAARWRLDRRAVERMAALRERYGPGPLLLPVPGARQAVMLDHAQVLPVLQAAPEPFAPASDEKRAALAHFEPRVSLASRDGARERRRALNDRALESDRPVHSGAARFATVIGEELGPLGDRPGPLDWNAFAPAWNRAVRRIVLGDHARDDRELTAMLAKLRAAGNWAMLRPRRHGLLRRYRIRLADHMARAEAGSLSRALLDGDDREPAADDAQRGGDRLGTGPGGEAVDQVTHWLFAFDPGGMATFRALALLAAHPDELETLRVEIDADEPIGPRSRLRATMLESLRLWPTTPAILRETVRTARKTGRTGSRAGTVELPEGTNLTIFAPYHHRAAGQPYADAFAPRMWDEGDGDGPNGATGDADTVADTATGCAHLGIVPFSAGPAACPARHLVPMAGAMGLRALLRGRGVRMVGGPAMIPGRLPATLDNSALAFEFGRVET